MKYVKEITTLGYSLCEGTMFEFKVNPYKSWNEIIGTVDTNILSDKREMRLNLRNLLLRENAANFTKALVALYHEYEHIMQYEACCYNYAPAIIVVELAARQQNDDFYNDNYSDFAYEIQAERAGVARAHSYIKQHHPELDAYECIKGYIDKQIELGDTRYIGFGFENCKNIEDIESCFDKVYENSLNKRNFQQIFYDYTNNNYIQRTNNNLIYQMINDTGYNDMRNILSMLDDGYEQTRFVASYNLTKIPEIKKTFKSKVIDKMDYKDYIKSYQQTGNNKDDFLEKIGAKPDSKDKDEMD